MKVRFGYTIIYVKNVQETLGFFGNAFGLETRFVHESGGYAEMETGATTLAFAVRDVADSHFPEGWNPLFEMDKPPGIEIALVTSDVELAVNNAVAEGAEVLGEPEAKSWGQTVAYVRSPDGVLIEICTPMTS